MSQCALLSHLVIGPIIPVVSQLPVEYAAPTNRIVLWSRFFHTQYQPLPSHTGSQCNVHIYNVHF